MIHGEKTVGLHSRYHRVGDINDEFWFIFDEEDGSCELINWSKLRGVDFVEGYNYNFSYYKVRTIYNLPDFRYVYRPVFKVRINFDGLTWTKEVSLWIVKSDYMTDDEFKESCIEQYSKYNYDTSLFAFLVMPIGGLDVNERLWNWLKLDVPNGNVVGRALLIPQILVQYLLNLCKTGQCEKIDSALIDVLCNKIGKCVQTVKVFNWLEEY